MCSFTDLKSWQDKLQLPSLTEQENVGEWDGRGKEREPEVLKMFRC